MNFNDELNEEVKQMGALHKVKKHAYYKQLMNPFHAPLCRYPSVVPVPSSLLRDRETFQITIGNAGDFVGFFAPENMFRRTTAAANFDFAFIAQSAASGTFYATLPYWDHLLSATGGNYASRVQQTQGGQYSTYFNSVRLVSAAIKFRYIGRAELLAGIITAGLIHINNPPAQTPYLSSAIAETMFPIRCPLDKDLVCNWLPFDSNSSNFSHIPTNSSFSGDISQQVFVFHGFGLPAGTVLDCEVVRNYEYIPKPAFHELLTPHSIDLRVLPNKDDFAESQILQNQNLIVTSTSDILSELEKSLFN